MSARSWHSVAASVTGATHAAAGTGNSDAHRIEGYGHDGIALVVADGLGASPEAALAARAAVAIAGRWLAAGPRPRSGADALAAQRDAVREAVMEARSGLLALADSLRMAPSDLGTTLLVCVASPAGTTFGGVGDGFLAVRARTRDGGHRHHLLTLAGPGAFANETATLASAHHIVVEALEDPDVDGVALVSDGLEAAAVEHSLGADRDLLAGVIDVLLAHADQARDSESLYHDLASADWDVAGADDRTIAMAVCR